MEAWQRLDQAPPDEAGRLLATCCGARAWIERMLARRPFGSAEELLAAARQEWFALTEDDWREAFSHHPKIGDRQRLRERFAATAQLSEREQRGVEGAAEEVLARLADGNQAYEEKFGYIFIVCATGKSAGEMLAHLETRLQHDPVREIHIAAGEQAKITELRLMELSR